MEESRALAAPTAAAPAAAVLIALGLLVLAACGRGRDAEVKAPDGGARRPTPAGAKAVEISEDPVKTGIATGDASLASAVRSRLAADPRLRGLRIEVDAEEGRVTLWGSAGSSQERSAAVEAARRTPGVSAVVDLIKVGAPPTGPVP
jgi:hypothetical protein